MISRWDGTCKDKTCKAPTPMDIPRHTGLSSDRNPAGVAGSLGGIEPADPLMHRGTDALLHYNLLRANNGAKSRAIYGDVRDGLS